MASFFIEYGLFLAKTITIIVGLLIVITAIFSLSQKGKSEEGTLLISYVNDRINEIRKSIQTETLSKSERKEWLKQEKKKLKEKDKNGKNTDATAKRMFVLDFDGDIRASDVNALKETINAIIESASSQDEVLLKIESAGGFVHSYGLAASQLSRLKKHNIHLTVAIDKVAASGGYLMACVADQIIAAPFSIVGSIGVLAQIPNFHRLLNKHNIDYEQHTAGEYKRTLTVFGKNTDKSRKKFQEDLEQTHSLFKGFITEHRPQVNIDDVATGEHWHASKAFEYKLVDEIKTSDDFILDKVKTHEVYELAYEEKQGITDKISHCFASAITSSANKIINSFSFYK